MHLCLLATGNSQSFLAISRVAGDVGVGLASLSTADLTTPGLLRLLLHRLYLLLSLLLHAIPCLRLQALGLLLKLLCLLLHRLGPLLLALRRAIARLPSHLRFLGRSVGADQEVALLRVEGEG